MIARTVWEEVCPLACRMDHISVMERPMPSDDAGAAADGAVVGAAMSGVRGRGGVATGAVLAFACKCTRGYLGSAGETGQGKVALRHSALVSRWITAPGGSQDTVKEVWIGFKQDQLCGDACCRTLLQVMRAT